MKLNKYWESFAYYVIVVLTTLKKVFSRSNFSDNSVQVPSSMHSNVQLLYNITIVLCRRRQHRTRKLLEMVGYVWAGPKFVISQTL